MAAFLASSICSSFLCLDSCLAFSSFSALYLMAGRKNKIINVLRVLDFYTLFYYWWPNNQWTKSTYWTVITQSNNSHYNKFEILWWLTKQIHQCNEGLKTWKLLCKLWSYYWQKEHPGKLKDSVSVILDKYTWRMLGKTNPFSHTFKVKLFKVLHNFNCIYLW